MKISKLGLNLQLFAASQFDSKNFNPELFGKYVDTIPKLKRNELLKSGAIKAAPQFKDMMSDQVGGNYMTVPLFGTIGGNALNYDGSTDITADTTKTYSHSRVVVGRAKGWIERDFSYDITGGVDFMDNVAKQVSSYWDEINQSLLLSILKGIFGMTGAENKKFVDGHTFDISSSPTGTFSPTTLNTALQRAVGQNKAKFSVAIMHSQVATNLENLQLLEYLKYTDSSGVQRDLTLATLNGRTVLIDDSMPVEHVYAVGAKTSDTAIDEAKTYYTRSGSAGSYIYTPVDTPIVGEIGNYYEVITEAYDKYTTYILGEGAFEFTDAGVKVPYEMYRNPEVNGGQDTLYSRQRVCYAPYGISFTKSSMVSLSPTDVELELGVNWELVNDSGDTKSYIDHKAIPIARIITRG